MRRALIWRIWPGRWSARAPGIGRRALSEIARSQRSSPRHRRRQRIHAKHTPTLIAGKEAVCGISKPIPSTRRCSTGPTSSSARRSSHSTWRGRTSSSCRWTGSGARPSTRSRKRSDGEGLWATHLGPELGGQGYGQLKLALLNEILGRSQWAPIVFGCQAPDTGNAEIIAHYGTPEQKEQYLRPLLEGEMFSSYSMTEPHGGADPTQFPTRAVRDGDDWVINGWKFFSSNAKTASFLIVMVVTNPDVSPYQGMSMFLVPTDTPGVKIVRNVGPVRGDADEGSHALIHYDNVRVPSRGAARRRRAGVRHRPDTARRRPDSPRDAHHRPLAQGTRHDVRTGAEPRDAREADCPTSSSSRATSPTPTRSCSVPADRALHRVGDRQVQRLQEGPQGHRLP